MALTDLKIPATKPQERPQKLVDGDGLYLYVSTAGTKSWRFDYAFGGKRCTVTIGKYPLAPEWMVDAGMIPQQKRTAKKLPETK
ncbi:DUF4102 domain-containing protein [Herbaspirillum sp. AP02]|uniref:Arm DNA-binding domain-containing protein n=1 Tax=unclassified Herbaspirillum TaxID=2624150 RepID=UPI0015DB8EC3|nr:MULTISPECIES: Arm DNA-binding domain-containing protein [unclassified Herbaspirillum]MBG7621006.1 DUF4102 domain-containing protein [Herbaspirillum sp. AP02]NZD68735.1 DUF4102 domain-containing protein [Herbaspirillum sp. AP21]